MIHPRQFFQSFRHALRGVGIVFRNEQSFRVQSAGALCAIVLGFYFSISNFQFLIIFVFSALVLVLEIINSIVERLIDSMRPRVHPIVRDIKDIMAGAVLIASLFSLAAGVVIFLPYL